MITTYESHYNTVLQHGPIMGQLPDTQNCGLHMHRECRELFPRHRLQKESLVSDPGMHHGTCVTRSLTRGGGENVPSIAGACATRNFAYLSRDPYNTVWYAAQQWKRHEQQSIPDWIIILKTLTVLYREWNISKWTVRCMRYILALRKNNHIASEKYV